MTLPYYSGEAPKPIQTPVVTLPVVEEEPVASVGPDAQAGKIAEAAPVEGKGGEAEESDATGTETTEGVNVPEGKAPEETAIKLPLEQGLPVAEEEQATSEGQEAETAEAETEKIVEVPAAEEKGAKSEESDPAGTETKEEAKIPEEKVPEDRIKKLTLNQRKAIVYGVPMILLVLFFYNDLMKALPKSTTIHKSSTMSTWERTSKYRVQTSQEIEGFANEQQSVIQNWKANGRTNGFNGGYRENQNEKRKENKTTNNNQSAISEQDSKNLRDIKNTLTVMLSRNQEFEVTGSPLFNEEKLRVLINEENQKILEALAQKLLSEKPQVAEEVEQPVQPIETEDITRLKSEKETYRKGHVS